MIDLQDKVTLVTGAGSGIGRAIAETFAKAGARVWVTDVDASSGEETVSRIAGEGGNASSLALDVRDQKQCAAVRDEVHRTDGRLDVLVNNAGVGHVGTATSTTLEDLDRLHDTGFTAENPMKADGDTEYDSTFIINSPNPVTVIAIGAPIGEACCH